MRCWNGGYTKYKLDHSKRALTDIDARGKITSPRDYEGEGFSQGRLRQLEHEYMWSK